MKLTKSRLRQIIKEELNKTLKEARLKDYIMKTSPLWDNSTPIGGSLMRVVMNNPELKLKARDASDPQGQMRALKEIGRLLAQDADILRVIGDEEPLDRHLDVVGLMRYAEQEMAHLWE